MPVNPKTPRRQPPTSFNVTQVIGTVSMDEHGELPPGLAAFKLIHDHDTPGTYTFPNVYGADTTVRIDAPDRTLDDEL